MAKINTTVAESVRTILDAYLPPKSRRNAEVLLFNVRKWQEAKAHSDKKLKAAWAALVLEGIIPDDDDLRSQHSLGGPHIIAEDGAFSVTLKVSSGGSSIDPDLLLDILVKRFKISQARAARAILDSKTENKTRLEKRVLEAGQ